MGAAEAAALVLGRAGGAAEGAVDRAVAVVVHAVADVRGRRGALGQAHGLHDAGVVVHAVHGQERGARAPGAVGAEDRPLLAVRGAGRFVEIHDLVAVVVLAVADLGVAGEDLRIEGLAVLLVLRAVRVVVVVTGVALAVPVGVLLRRVEDQGTVVVAVEVAVAVVVVVDAVGDAVVVGVRGVLVDGPVAVVVDAVAGLGLPGVDVGVEGLAVSRLRGQVEVVGATEALLELLHAVAIQVHVEVPGHAALGALLVGDVVAVVVLAVAGLEREVVHLRVQGRAVREVGLAVVVVVAVALVAEAVPVGVYLARIVRAGAVVLGIGDAVAVVVVVAEVPEAVAVEIRLARVRDQGAVVQEVRDAVAVVVVVAGVAQAVAVGVELVRVGDQGAVVQELWDAVAVLLELLELRQPAAAIARVAEAVAVGVHLVRVGHLGAVVVDVGDPVAVVVVVGAVRGPVSVDVLEPLVDLEVAVVIEAVADLGDRALDGVALVGGTVDTGWHRVEALAQAAGERTEVLVHRVVAVVVDAVAELRRRGVDRGVQGRAVVVVAGEVVVVVVVADVPHAVEVEVLLERVRDLVAVVGAVGDAVAVVVVGHAVRQAVAVGVGEALVGLPVAVVVLAVAGLLGRAVEGIAAVGRAVLAVRCRVLTFALAAAGLSEVLVHVPVAVVVLSVAGLRGGGGRVAMAEAALFAEPRSGADTELVGGEAGGGEPERDGRVGAVAGLRVEDALVGRAAARVELRTGEARRAVPVALGVVLQGAWTAAEAAGVAVGDAEVILAQALAVRRFVAGLAEVGQVGYADEDHVPPAARDLLAGPPRGALLDALLAADLLAHVLDAPTGDAVGVVVAGLPEAALARLALGEGEILGQVEAGVAEIGDRLILEDGRRVRDRIRGGLEVRRGGGDAGRVGAATRAGKGQQEGDEHQALHIALPIGGASRERGAL